MDKQLLFNTLAQSSFFMVNKAFIKELGLECAMQLSLYIDCSRRFDGDFYFRHDEFSEALGITRQARNKHDKKLENLGFLTKELRQAPAKMFYTLNYASIIAFLSKFQGAENNKSKVSSNEQVKVSSNEQVHIKKKHIKQKQKDIFNNISKKDGVKDSFNLEEKEKEEVYLVGEYKNIKLTMEQYERLKKFYGSMIHFIQMIDRLCSSLEENPKAYKNHYLVLRKWKALKYSDDYFSPQDTHQHACRVNLPGFEPIEAQ